MVNRLERAYSKGHFLFISSDLQYQQIKLMHFGPCYLGSKGLQQACNKLELKHSGGGSFREASIRPRVRNLAVSFSFLLDLLKNRKQ